jgi:hypothetical protein
VRDLLRLFRRCEKSAQKNLNLKRITEPDFSVEIGADVNAADPDRREGEVRASPVFLQS